MKYTSTSKTLSMIFHAIIALGCCAMGLYFGFFVVPFAFTSNPYQFSDNLFAASFYLYLELAVIGLAFAIISGYGFVKAFLSFSAGGNSDQMVRDSLTAFICEGYVAAVTLLLNGSVLFNAMTGSETASITFPIVMCILLSIVLLIATNIPMVRMYDGHDYSPLLKGLSLTGGITLLVLSFETLLALIGLYTRSFTATTNPFMAQIVAILVPTLVAGALLLAAGILLKKKEASAKSVKFTTIALGAAMIVLSATFICEGAFEFIWQDYNYHLIGILNENAFLFPGLGYGIMCIIAAVILIGGGITAIIYSGQQTSTNSKGTKHTA